MSAFTYKIEDYITVTFLGMILCYSYTIQLQYSYSYFGGH